MKLKFILLSLFMILLAAPAFSQDWLLDYDTAISEAKASDKPVLIFFTGSDWCPPCKMTTREVYDKEEFKEFADQELVLVLADFPKRKQNQLSKAQKQKNNALAAEFGVRGFPTSILLDNEGKELGRWVGYDPAGLDGYLRKFRKAANL